MVEVVRVVEVIGLVEVVKMVRSDAGRWSPSIIIMVFGFEGQKVPRTTTLPSV